MLFLLLFIKLIGGRYPKAPPHQPPLLVSVELKATFNY